MATRKFKVTFSVDYEIDVEVDPKIYDDEFVQAFQRHFYDLDEEAEPIMDIASHLAQYHARLGHDTSFIEGYGSVTRDGQLTIREQFSKEEIKPSPGLNIIPIQDEFDPWNIEVVEVKEKTEQ